MQTKQRLNERQKPSLSPTEYAEHLLRNIAIPDIKEIFASLNLWFPVEKFDTSTMDLVELVNVVASHIALIKMALRKENAECV